VNNDKMMIALLL